MNLYLGLDDFKDLLYTDEPNWFRYYDKYKEIFDVLFHKLYVSDVEHMKPVIDSLDFFRLYKHAEEGCQIFRTSKFKGILQKCLDFFDFKEQIEVYALVGFGHIDRAAPPADKPFLYFGLERLPTVTVAVLIPHEFNHMVRFHMLKYRENLTSFTVKQLVVAEGLATITPLMIFQEDLTDQNLAKAMMLPEMEYLNLVVNFHEIERDIRENLNLKVNPHLMDRYFMANEGSGRPSKSGYYYGLHIILKLIKKGYELKNLTGMKTDDIWSLYLK